MAKQIPLYRPTIVTIVAIILLIVLALSGGSSRSDEPLQVSARLAAITAMILLQFAPNARKFSTLKVGFSVLAAIALFVAMQLVPLPVWLWSALPGREPFLEAAKIAEISQPWRPIAIAPDLAIGSFLALLFPLAALTILIKLPEDDYRFFLIAMICVMITSSVIGIAQFIQKGQDIFHWYTVMNTGLPTGMFANRNHQAIFLAMGLPCIASWISLSSTKSLNIIFSFIAVSIIIFTIILSESRAGILILILNIFLSLFLMKKFLGNSIKWFNLLIVTVFTLAIFIALQWMNLFTVGERFSSTNFDELRFQIIPIIVTLCWRFFPVGSGFGSFEVIYRMIEPFNLLGPEYLNHAHNDFLELVLEGGLVALFAISLFLIIWIRRVISIWSSQYKSNIFVFGCLGSILTGNLLLASIFDYPVRTPMLSFVFAIACGWMEFAFRARVARRLPS